MKALILDEWPADPAQSPQSAVLAVSGVLTLPGPAKPRQIDCKRPFGPSGAAVAGRLSTHRAIFHNRAAAQPIPTLTLP
jgi:hypothetical protein